MSVETGKRSDGELQWRAPLGLTGARVATRAPGRLASRPFADSRGPTVSLRRDALFRRALLGADVVAILGALVLTVALSSRKVPLHLTWESLVGVPLLLIGAKLLGLYDRDETLLRKTTLDEAPKLFQLATLCTLVALLAGRLVVAGTLDRKEALFLWIALAALLLLCARRGARASRCGSARPSAACSSATSARRRWSAAKLSGHGGIKAKIVAQLDLGQVAPWSTDALLGAAADGDPRSRADARRAARDHRAGLERRRGRRGDAQPGAHAEGRRHPRERAAADARGRRLVGRVRRPARRHADGRAPLRPDALLGGAQARVRPARRLARAARDLAADDRLRDRDQARQPRPGVCSASCASGATGGASRCSSSARWCRRPTR